MDPEPAPAGVIEPPGRHESMTAPLRYPIFRQIWAASLVSNMGLLIQGVGAAWIMTQLTSAAGPVALVQTAQMLPVMMFALAAGAIADMYDRRKVALLAILLALTGSISLSALAFAGAITPPLLLAFCFVIGSGMAFLWPAWQASVSEQVPATSLPAAIALNSISYNIARSFGPAIGGMIVAAAGAVAAFGVNALCYLPLLVVLYRWKRVQEPSRLPPESLGRAIVSGVRYVVNSPPIRIVLIRTLMTGVIGGALAALLPLVARILLQGTAQTYGLMLGCFGIGAVSGALNVARLRRAISDELLVRCSTFAMGLATVVVSLSHNPFLTGAALIIAGGGWMLSVTSFNIGIQVSAPRWVAGRALATFQASIAGGIAIGSWGWGNVAQTWDVHTALLCSGVGVTLLPLAGLWLRMPEVGEANREAEESLADPEVRMALTARSGPIVVQIEYRIDSKAARPFYRLMQELQLARHRNGAYDWTLARDIADPDLWVESYSCPTWLDYLRQRSRTTQDEWELRQRAREFHVSAEPIRISRRLERPLGSVRWKEEAPDNALPGASAPSPQA